MNIEVENPEQFGSLLNALVNECVNAEIYYRLHKNLLTAIPEYKEVFNESNTFWSLTVRALLDATLSCLCRAYDQHSKSLSLRNLLVTIEANLEIFDTAHFKNRLRDNPFVESLAQTARKPNTDKLDRDKKLVSDKDPLVKKLVMWRNNIISHKSASNVINDKDITKYYPLTGDEVSKLVTRATNIANSYSSLFQASTTSTQIVGHDDYLYVLKSIKELIRKQKQEIASAIARSQRSHNIHNNR
jgi:hypothetical protein